MKTDKLIKIHHQLIHNGKAHSTGVYAWRRSRKEVKALLDKIQESFSEGSSQSAKKTHIKRSPLVFEVTIYDGIGADGNNAVIVSRYSPILK